MKSVRKTLLAKESSRETLRSSRQSLMTGSSCQAAHGLFLCLPWVRERGSGPCENVLRSVGRKVLSWNKRASGACLLGTGGCFFEARFPGLRRRCLVLSFTRGHSGDQNGDPSGPKMEAHLPSYFY
jgi:hypothetical protein